MKKDILRVFSTNLIKTLSVLIVSFFVPSLLSLGQYADYKLFALYASYIGVLHFGFCDGIFLYYGGKTVEENRNLISREVSTISFFELLISAGFIIYGVAASNQIIMLIGMDILPVIMITYFGMLYQAVGDFSSYSRMYNLSSLITFLSNALLVFVIRKDNGYYFMISTVIVNWLIAGFALLTYKRKNGFSIHKPDIYKLTRTMRGGILLTIGNMSYILFASIDKWFVKGLLTTDHFAYYSFTVQLLSALNMFITPIGLTLYSYFSRKKNESFEFDLKTIIISLLFFMLGGVFVIRFIIRNYIPKYQPAEAIIVILFLAQVFSLLNTSIYVNLFKTYNRQKKYFFNLMLIIIFSAVANAVFYFLLGKNMEMIACATLLSMIVWALINLSCFRYLKMRVNHYLFMVTMILSFLFCNYTFETLLGCVIYLLIWGIAIRVLMKNIYCLGKTEIRKLLRKKRRIV